MIPYQKGKLKFSLKNSWSEITVSDMDALRSIKIRKPWKGVDKALAILSGVPDSKWRKWLKEKSFPASLINQALFYIKKPVNYSELELPSHISIGGKLYKIPGKDFFDTFMKGYHMLDFQTLILPELQASGNGIAKIAEMLAIIFYEPITGEKYDSDHVLDLVPMCRESLFIEAFPAAKYFYDQLLPKVKREREKLKYDPLSEEIEAGIEQLSEYGPMMSLYSLADGDLLKFDAILHQPYSVIFITQRMKLSLTLYHRRLSKIIANKNKIPKIDIPKK